MDQTLDSVVDRLLPKPRRAQALDGACRIGRGVELRCDVPDARVERAIRAWCSTLPRAEPPTSGGPVVVILASDASTAAHRHGYRLSIGPDRIELVGGSPAGCFHGFQTLAQMTRQAQRDASARDRAAAPIALPCCRLDDAPDFATRGLLHDVTRGKAPRLDTLKVLVDRLAALKINQLHLYIEHAFVFPFDAEICGPSEGVTPDEVINLDAYCKDRFIELVPAVATLGHMGRILSMPKYRHLAEIEATARFAEMDWPKRARGLTLDCVNPESHRLVERIWSDILDAFSSPVVNICGDEPWDLGKGKNAERFAQSGVDAYVEHVRRTHDICAARGRRTQLWSDVIRKHPRHVERLPRASTLLHWGYDDQADYDGTAAMVDSGLETIVCPGTSGWKRIINAIGLAERNISTFARVGRASGATGLLNTDWGDHGHFNALACSWHGIALGAALAWSADHPIGVDFDRRFARAVWDQSDDAGVRCLRAAARLADRCETWRLMWTPTEQTMDDPTWPDVDQVAELRAAATALRRWCETTRSEDRSVRDDLAELATAALFSVWFADRADGMNRRRSGARQRNDERDCVNEGSMRTERSRAVTEQYADRWRRRNKPSGLSDIVAALSFAARECTE